MAEPTKDELKETIRELKAKLKEMKAVEEQLISTAKDLSQSAIGVHRDEKGKYHLVHLKYDIGKNAAAISKVEALDSHDFAIAAHKSKEELVNKILRKARGDKYVD